jgi:hypothetical protein
VLLYEPINSARNSVWSLWQPDTENSNFPLASIERIFFDNDTWQIKIHGKGHGEGEIIHYAIEYSK